MYDLWNFDEGRLRSSEDWIRIWYLPIEEIDFG